MSQVEANDDTLTEFRLVNFAMFSGMKQKDRDKEFIRIGCVSCAGPDRGHQHVWPARGHQHVWPAHGHAWLSAHVANTRP